MILLDIPPRFQEPLLEGVPIGIQMQVESTNSVLGTLAASFGTMLSLFSILQLIFHVPMRGSLGQLAASADEIFPATLLSGCGPWNFA